MKRSEPLVKRSAQGGYSLMEVVVTLAVFGVFLWIIVILTNEMRAQEKRFPVNYFTHPEASSVVARLRRDVYDSKYYPLEYTSGTGKKYAQSPKCLLLSSVRENGTSETVVYDFNTKAEVRRLTFVGPALSSEWVAHSVPDFEFHDYELESGAVAVRISGTDGKGRMAVDEIFLPRPHD